MVVVNYAHCYWSALPINSFQVRSCRWLVSFIPCTALTILTARTMSFTHYSNLSSAAGLDWSTSVTIRYRTNYNKSVCRFWICNQGFRCHTEKSNVETIIITWGEPVQAKFLNGMFVVIEKVKSIYKSVQLATERATGQIMELCVGVSKQILDLSSNIEQSAGYERTYDIVTQFEQRRYIERSFKKERKKERRFKC